MSWSESFLFKSLYAILFLALSCSSATIIRLTRNQPLKDGDTLVSDVGGGGRFTLGFFSPPPSSNSQRYLGIWYNDDPDSGSSVVWVANRDRPIPDRTGSLTISADWNLILSDGNGSSIWSTRAPITAPPTVAVLSPTGNLFLSPNDSVGDSYWQSFDVPTDTFSPGMKVLVDASAGPVVNAFRSWKSPGDPSPGKFTMGIDPQGAPQIVIWENLERRWRSGMWNGIAFTGMNNAASASYMYGFKLYREEDNGRVYFSYVPSSPTDSLRFRVDWDGNLEQLRWNRTRNLWDVVDRQPAGECQRYNFCGKFGVCNELGRPKCKCMEGFRPANLGEWSRGHWSGGCERIESLRCESGGGDGEEGGTNADKFDELRCGKLPDFANLRSFRSPESCRRACVTECECHGYAMMSGIGCVMWTVDMVDVVHSNGSNNVLYLRIPNSEPGGSRNLSRTGTSKRVPVGVIAAIVVGGVVGLAAASLLLCRKITGKRLKADSEMPLNDAMKNSSAYTTAELTEGGDIHVDTPLFSFALVALAADEFSMENKLGEGGFGPVYKGRLPGGEEIAVKRLSKISGQGLEEFKNEISLIAKLQHRNLVRLLGYCVHDEEKMLIYEYMPNKSLDFFLFDPAKQATLSWRKRLMIIKGIARGLLYLHQDSRLRVIHRDLKASNVLLDEEMNPKISDFGMARIFGGNQNEANTNRVVGTYGYMAPEYAMEGLFSVKSDVYSFGILVLEIVSGRKNTSFRFSDHVSLIAYAWELWSQGRAMEMVDSSVRDSCMQDEMLRCIQVGILCVQGDPVHRPTMAEVMLMMERDSQSLPLPRQPTFTCNSTTRGSVFRDVDSEGQVSVSNELTVTMVVGR
ncbi:G-type lectin S-receptor-like serine/threonine-protein kinase B120 [Linum grandiflorum]